MSGPEPLPDGHQDPALDPGLLDAGPLLEIGGWRAVAALGGAALLHWRGTFRQACSSAVGAPQ